jgi:2,5-dihydroxypyridine 5,6-dioxygenase
MESLLTGTLEYLRRPFAANVRSGDQVLIVTDTAHDVRVWQAIMSIVSDYGGEPILALFDPRPADYFDPPKAVCEAMLRSDINVLVATTGMLHSPANLAAMEAGVPALCLDGGMTLEMLQSGAITADLVEMATTRHYVAKNVFGEGARICRVTSRYGTDLTYDVTGRIFVPPLPDPERNLYEVARLEGRPESPLLRHLFPGGEFNVPPIEGSANGRLVVDLTMHQLGLLKDPIELEIVDGRVVEINGGVEAWRLRDYLARYGDENAYMCPAEASVGINRKALVRGVQREDKNIFGSMHFGLGTNIDVGGTIRSTIHMDGVILEPSLYVDDELRIKHGVFQVLVEPA